MRKNMRRVVRTAVGIVVAVPMLLAVDGAQAVTSQPETATPAVTGPGKLVERKHVDKFLVMLYRNGTFVRGEVYLRQIHCTDAHGRILQRQPGVIQPVHGLELTGRFAAQG